MAEPAMAKPKRPHLRLERDCPAPVCGVDEAGRGPWAGPVSAAALILAKTARDRLMRELDLTHPGYGFAAHKGYGVPEHAAALERLGPCPIHRRTWAPVMAAARDGRSHQPATCD